MTIKVTLEFSSVDETIAALNKLVGASGNTAGAERSPDAPTSGVIPDASAIPQTPVAARRGRPPKAAAPVEGQPIAALQTSAPVAAAPSPVPVEQRGSPMLHDPAPIPAAIKQPNQPVQAIANGVNPLKTDELRPMLKAVFDKKGAKVATDILKQFEAARISDIKPEKSRAFAGACEAALKS